MYDKVVKKISIMRDLKVKSENLLKYGWDQEGSEAGEDGMLELYIEGVEGAMFFLPKGMDRKYTEDTQLDSFFIMLDFDHSITHLKTMGEVDDLVYLLFNERLERSPEMKPLTEDQINQIEIEAKEMGKMLVDWDGKNPVIHD